MDQPTQTPGVHLVDASGNIGLMPQDQALEAVKSGQFQIATPEQIQDLKMEQQYGEGLGNTASAFGAGLLRGGTLGLSDQLLIATGAASPEALRELEQRHGIASLGGEATGIIGSSFIPGVGAAQTEVVPAKIASKLAASVTEKALPIAERAATKLVNPETSPLVHKILAQSGAHALGSAVEGAVYGAGRSVTEEALGDPELNAEKVLSNIGLSAMYAGALGGALATGAEVIPPVVNKAKESISKVADMLGATAKEGYVKGSAFFSGKPEELIRQAINDRELAATSLSEKQGIVKDFSESIQKQYDDLSKMSQHVSSKVRPQENRVLLQDMDPALAGAELDKINNSINSTIEKLKSEPDIYPQSFARKVEVFRDNMQKNLTAGGTWDAAGAFEAINGFKKDIDPLLKFERQASISEKDAINVLKGLRSEIKGSLENENVWGKAGVAQTEFNDALTEHLHAEKMFRKNFMKKVPRLRGGDEYVVDPSKMRSFFRNINNETGAERLDLLSEYLAKSEDLISTIEKRYEHLPNAEFNKDSVSRLLEKNKIISDQAVKQAEYQNTLNQLGAGKHNVGLAEGAAMGIGLHNPAIGGLIEAYNMASHPGIAIQRFTAIEEMAKKVGSSIDKASSVLFKQMGKGAVKLKGFEGKELMRKQQERDDLPKAIGVIKELSSNPDKFVDVMEKNIGPLADHAPQIAQNISYKAGSAVQFLQSKLPQMPQAKPFSKPYQLSPSEVYKFERYYNVVKNPVGIFDDIASGTLTKESIEALSAVYPKMYQDMKGKIFDQLTKYGTKKDFVLPYAAKMSLSLFLGENIDDSLKPETIAANQLALNAPQSVQGQQQQTMKGTEDLHLSGMYATDLQKAAGRKDKTV